MMRIELTIADEHARAWVTARTLFVDAFALERDPKLAREQWARPRFVVEREGDRIFARVVDGAVEDPHAFARAVEEAIAAAARA